MAPKRKQVTVAAAERKKIGARGASGTTSHAPHGPNNAKRSRRAAEEPADPIAPKIQMVKAMLDSSEYQVPKTPKEVRGLLLKSAQYAFEGPAEGRHEFQKQAAAMIQDFFMDVREELEAELAPRRKLLKQVTERKLELEARVKEALDLLEAKKQVVQEKQEAKRADEEHLQSAEQQVTKAKEAIEELSTLKGNLEKEQQKVASVDKECFKVLRDSPPAAKKEVDKLIKRLSPVLAQTLKIDASLSESLPHACLKAPEARGDFDKMALTSVGSLIERYLQAGEEGVSKFNQQLQAAEAASAATIEVQQTAEQKLAQTVQLLASAEQERKEHKKHLEAKQAELAKYEKDVVSRAQTDSKAGEKKLAHFAEAEDALRFLTTPESAKKNTQQKEEMEEEVIEDEEEEAAGEEEEDE